MTFEEAKEKHDQLEVEVNELMEKEEYILAEQKWKVALLYEENTIRLFAESVLPLIEGIWNDYTGEKFNKKNMNRILKRIEKELNVNVELKDVSYWGDQYYLNVSSTEKNVSVTMYVQVVSDDNHNKIIEKTTAKKDIERRKYYDNPEEDLKKIDRKHSEIMEKVSELEEELDEYNKQIPISFNKLSIYNIRRDMVDSFWSLPF